MAQIDETTITNGTMPKSWVCPRCGRRNKTGMYAEGILIRYFKYLEHCTHCGAVHLWRLELTQDFKEKIVAMMKGGGLNGRNNEQ